MARLVTLALVLVLASPAWGAEGWLRACTLSPSCPKPSFSPPWVYVWKSPFAAEEGQSLLAARRGDRTLLVPLLACAFNAATLAAASDWAGGYIRVVVIEGPSKGCRGYIDDLDWKRKD
jgi:hypothetical protein